MIHPDAVYGDNIGLTGAAIGSGIVYIKELAYPDPSQGDERDRFERATWAMLIRSRAIRLQDVPPVYRGRAYEVAPVLDTISKTMRPILRERVPAAAIAMRLMGMIEGDDPAPSIAAAFRDAGRSENQLKDAHARVWQRSVPVLHLSMGLLDSFSGHPGVVHDVFDGRWGRVFKALFIEPFRPDWLSCAVNRALQYATAISAAIPEVKADQLAMITLDLRKHVVWPADPAERRAIQRRIDDLPRATRSALFAAIANRALEVAPERVAIVDFLPRFGITGLGGEGAISTAETGSKLT